VTAPLRVLIVMPLATPLGGGEQSLRQLLKHGRDRGITWRVIYLRDGPMVSETRALGIDADVIDAGRFRQIGKRFRAVRRVAALAREWRADLIFGWMVAGQLIAGAAGLFSDIPVVWYQVGLPRPDWLDRAATALPARGILVNSRACGVAQARVWPHRAQQLVYPGASLDDFTADALPTLPLARAALGLPSAGPLVGIVARLQRWKGVHVFVDAVALAAKKHPDLQAVVVGGAHETEPGYTEELQARARQLGIESRIRFAGFQPNVPEWMQAMDIVVHASDREPFGMVVVEAMALGKPVIAGQSGGPAEIITDGVDGVLAPFGDAPALGAAISRLIDDPALARRLGSAARARAAAFDERAFAAHVMTALRSFLGTP
jgi:glycosyltransferase involved in cell wall biosynthesis